MNPEDYLPLSAPMYSILVTLGEDSLHGYGIIRRFEDETGQEGALLPGSVYNTLSRLMRQGLVQEVPPPEDDEDGRRRYYCVTETGRAVARAETARLQSLLNLAESGGLAGG